MQRPLYDAFVAGVADLMATVRLGDPRDPAHRPGPAGVEAAAGARRPASSTERATYAKVVRGGQAPSGDLANGSYYEPTLVVGAAQDSEIVQHEVFGPVLVVLPFDSDDEGLRAGQRHPVRAGRLRLDARRVPGDACHPGDRAGCVWVNDHIPIISEMPHGGYKGSGFGKDMSQYSLEEYTQIKHVMVRHHRGRAQGLAPDGVR